MTRWQSENALAECRERLEWQLSHLQARDREWRKAKQAQRVAQDRLSRVERAFAFVFTAGVLEDLFRRLNEDVPEDLKRLELHRTHLRPSALAVLAPQAWDSLGGDKVVRLARRTDVISTANEFYSSSEPLDFSGLALLGVSDGRTVNVHNFEVLWEGLCLSSPASEFWISIQHKQAISTLADKRNLIAHFEADPREEAFRWSYADLALMLERVKDLVEKLEEHLLLWLDRHEKR